MPAPAIDYSLGRPESAGRYGIAGAGLRPPAAETMVASGRLRASRSSRAPHCSTLDGDEVSSSALREAASLGGIFCDELFNLTGLQGRQALASLRVFSPPPESLPKFGIPECQLSRGHDCPSEWSEGHG